MSFLKKSYEGSSTPAITAARCAVGPTPCREEREEGGEEGDSGDTVIKTGENNLRLKQEGPTHSVQPLDSLLPVDLSEEFGTTLSLVYDSIVPLCMRTLWGVSMGVDM